MYSTINTSSSLASEFSWRRAGESDKPVPRNNTSVIQTPFVILNELLRCRKNYNNNNKEKSKLKKKR